jgi:uncharacterized protein YjbI with pentapeptide repeats
MNLLPKNLRKRTVVRGIIEVLSAKPRSTGRRQGLRKLSPDLIVKAWDETATQVTRIGLTFVGTAAFCLLSLLTPDSALLGGSEKINVPLAGPVSFFGFMLLGPALLIGLRVYLQIYVEHSERLDRLARSLSAVRAPTLLPLQNSLIQLLSNLTRYLLLPVTLLLFAWKAAVFPVWGSSLFAIAIAAIVSHVMLPFGRLSWGSKALLSVSAAAIAAVVMLGLKWPLHRPFDLFRANLSDQWLLGEDLRQANLRYATLRGANLNFADLSGADLSGADLNGAKLHSGLEGANLSGAVLTGADLSGASLSRADLSLANLTGANLSSANMKGALLGGANLSGANLNFAVLIGANLNFAVLRGAGLSTAVLSNASLSSAKLSGANLSGAYLNGAFLSGADLSGADLNFADLSGADLSDQKNVPRGEEVYLSGADLSSANMKGALLSGANLSGAKNLTQTQLDGACGNSTKLPEGLMIKPCSKD